MNLNEDIQELKVSGNTQPNKLGGAIANYLREDGEVVVTAMGDSAVNQLCKGLIVAKSFIASTTSKLIVNDVGFLNRFDETEGKEITLIAFNLKME